MSNVNSASLRSKMVPLASTRGHQCPDCFSFNWVERLPQDRKREHQGKTLITCALCKSEYAADMPELKAA